MVIPYNAPLELQEDLTVAERERLASRALLPGDGIRALAMYDMTRRALLREWRRLCEVSARLEEAEEAEEAEKDRTG